jgi:hypothetical protein
MENISVHLPLQTAFTKLVLCCKMMMNAKVKMTDSDMANSWQHLCQKFDISAEVALNYFIGMDSDAIVVQDVTEDGIASKILMAKDGRIS